MNGEELGGFVRDQIEQPIPTRFEKQVAQHATRIAIRTRNLSLTYEDLNHAANRIAAVILEQHGDCEEPVAILLEQSTQAVIAILAILKAGKFYLPLDSTHPSARLAAQLKDSGARLLLTEEKNAFLAQSLAEGDISILDMNSVSARSSDANPKVELTPDRLAYLFYTSGSTGDPKGVIDNHRNVLHNVMRYTNNLFITPDDRLSLIQAPAFSGTVSSLFCALLNGASICPFDLRKEGFEALATWVNETGITIYHSVPAIFRGLVSGDRQFPAIRVVRLEGDQTLPLDVDLHRKFFSKNSLLAIGLGATETGLSCQYLIDADTKVDARTIPVGYPTLDMTVSIRDEKGTDLGKMMPGEIAVQGQYLAVGYWRNTGLQREAFLPDPTDKKSRIYLTGDRGQLHGDGCLEFLGRQDSNSRIRGQRVELGLVEAALVRTSGISQAAAAIREDASGSPVLVGYLVSSSGHEPTVSAIRSSLARELPDCMIPTLLVYLKSLPLSDNGKVDRRRLPEPLAVQNRVIENHRPARDDTEIKLIRVWEEVLGQSCVGPADNFFELGGDSLKAALICAKIERIFGKKIPVHSLYDTPTVTALAAALLNAITVHQTETLVALQPRGSKPPLYFVHEHFGQISWYGSLASRLGADQPCYGLQVAAESDLQAGITSIEDLANYYINEIRALQPSGLIHVAGLCFGGVVAFEIAQQLAARCEPVGLVALIGITPYDFPGAIAPIPAFLWRRHAQAMELAGRVRRIPRQLRSFSSRKDRRYRRIYAASVDADTQGTESGLTGAVAGSLPAKSQAIAAHHTKLFRNYDWRPYPGRLELFLEARMARIYTRHPVEDWRRLSTRGVRSHLNPFRVSKMFTEAHVDTLAMQMRRSLESYGEV